MAMENSTLDISKHHRTRTGTPYYLLLMWLAVNDGYSLLPGNYRLSDIALVLIGMHLGWVLFRSRERSLAILKNPFTWLFLVFLVLATAQASFAALNYGESVPSGIIGVRKFYYFLSFFLFILILDDLDKVRKFLDLLSGVAIILFVLSLINYFGPTLFTHQYAEGHGERAGIVRAFIPGLETIAIAFFWSTSKLICSAGASSGKRRSLNAVLSVLLLGAIFFRQTRARIIATCVALIWLLITKRHYKALMGISLAGVICVSVAQALMEENIFLVPFMSAVEEVTEGTGNWRFRFEGMEAAWEVFREHPIFGSGSIALRVDVDIISNKAMRLVGKTSDLGHINWLKHFGLAGVVWLVGVFSLLWFYGRRSEKLLPQKYAPMALLVQAYVPYFMISFVTIGHLFRAEGIAMVSLLAAIVVRSLYLYGDHESRL